MTSPLEVYGEDLASSLVGAGATTWLRSADGTAIVLDLPRWIAPATGADQALLARCAGPALDIGCGPGRLTRALVALGLECLGVDVAPVAVDLARLGGTPVLHASVYDAVLDGTCWATLLLADGNIGIGGDAVRLLERCRQLLAPGGSVLVELDGPHVPTGTGSVRIESSSGRMSSWFAWAHVSVADIEQIAAAAGLSCRQVWPAGGRWFAELEVAT